MQKKSWSVIILILIFLILVLVLYRNNKGSFFPATLLASRSIFNLVYPVLPPKPKMVVTPAPTLTMLVTFYGYADNDPPGKAIAFPRSRFPTSLREQAGGVGSYTDPVTIAVKKDWFKIGTRLYIPTLKKYGIVEDTCASCIANQIDVWMESTDQFKKELLTCERKWTLAATGIELNPTPNRPVNLQPFFDPTTGQCH